MYGVNTMNFAWFVIYLNGRKQYIKITECANAVKKDFKSEAPQGSIIGPLLFLLYIKNPPNSLNVLIPRMFADDTIFFLNTVT